MVVVACKGAALARLFVGHGLGEATLHSGFAIVGSGDDIVRAKLDGASVGLEGLLPVGLNLGAGGRAHAAVVVDERYLVGIGRGQSSRIAPLKSRYPGVSQGIYVSVEILGLEAEGAQ